MAEDIPADVYLKRLADAAQEWFQKRPAEPAALARRIAEFRQGCSTRIFAAHRPLAPEDRSWLVAKCRSWAARLDAELEALEAGQESLEVRAEVDGTITKLSAAIRQRAESVAPG